MLAGDYRHLIDNFVVIDCRFDYEFEGGSSDLDFPLPTWGPKRRSPCALLIGHVRDALHMKDVDEVIKYFLIDNPPRSDKTALIFHCEFSSHRGPAAYATFQQLASTGPLTLIP